MIRPATPADVPAILKIYNPYILNSTITFEEEAVSPEEMTQRIQNVSSTLPWFVYEHENEVVAYAYATPWRARSAYRLSVETTVYVHADHTGKGIGKQLYQSLIADLKSRGLHAVVAGIALPNPASIALHEAMGFEKVAQFKEIGMKFGQRLDVGYWELLL